MIKIERLTNYEVIKKKMPEYDEEYQLLRRGIISIQIYSHVKRYERFLLYRQVFEIMEAQKLTATDMKCDIRTVRRAIEWCESVV